jgi:hypothetical protein
MAMETPVARKIVGYVLLAIGAFWLFLAGVFMFWSGRWEWDPLAVAFAFWFVVAALPFLIAGWLMLLWKH